MSSSAKITWLIGVLVIAGFAIAAQFVSVRERTITQRSYTINAGELTRDVLVGQTFRSEQDNLSAIGVLFATYSNRANTQPINFHLRKSPDATEDLRRATVQPTALGDNQLYRFEFAPITNSAAQTYFFFITSPESTPGNAVTIDLDTRNPYHLGSAFVVRGQGPQVTDPAVLARSGKQTQDIGFEVYHTVPLRVAVVHSVRNTMYTLISTWDERRGQYVLWSRAALPALAFMVIAYIFYSRSQRDPGGERLSRRATFGILLLFVVFGISMRLMYADALPFTEDEGNYLYDARTLREGMLAGGDGYVKSPLSIAWLALWQAFTGHSLLASRLPSIVIGTLTLFPIYSLGRSLKNKYTGLLAAAAWSLVGAAAVFNIYIHTQPIALFFGISGLAVLWQALRRGDSVTSSYGIPRRASLARQLLLAGVLLGLGVASRKSILALGLVPFVLILLESTSWRQRFKNLISVGIGFALVIGIFLSMATWLYGPEGFWEALGVNSATDGIATRDISEIENERAYSLRGMTPFFRESLPLIILSLIGWGYLLEHLLRRTIQRVVTKQPPRLLKLLADHFMPKIGWVPALLAFAWAFWFFFEYEGTAFMFYGMKPLWYAMGVALVLLAAWPRPNGEALTFAEKPVVAASTQPTAGHTLPPNLVGSSMRLPKNTISHAALLPLVSAALLLPAWMGGLVFFYVNWIKFHANYLSEFIPPVVVLSGVGIMIVWQRLGVSQFFLTDHPLATLVRRLVTLFVLTTITWALFLSNYITYVYEHTGTFDQAGTRAAAGWAKENIPLDQPIFTGASLVTYISGHHNALNISHPRWYAYESIRTDASRLTTFMPSVEEMLQAYRDSQWFLLDKQTGFSYLMEYSEIERGLQTDFTVVQEIENGSNTLTFYQRAK